MKKFSIFFLLLFTLSNFSFAENNTSKLKSAGQELKEQNISLEELCNTACESEFRHCSNDDKKNSWSCLSKTLTCKNKCKKDSGNK